MRGGAGLDLGVRVLSDAEDEAGELDMYWVGNEMQLPLYVLLDDRAREEAGCKGRMERWRARAAGCGGLAM